MGAFPGEPLQQIPCILIRLAFNAISLAPGGGLNGLIGYLRAWQEIGAPLEITLYASRPPVLDAVQRVRPDIRLVPYAVTGSTSHRYFLQRFDLGRRMERQNVDVVMSTQQMVGRCRLPQLVHHRNLKRFLYRRLLQSFLHGGPDEMMKDIVARESLHKSDCNVFISDYLRREAERFVRASAPRNHVVYNGLSSSLLAAAESPFPGWDGRPHLAAIQTPVVHKDNPTLLRALRYVVDREPHVPWRLTVAGEWDWSRVREMAGRLGIADRVEFVGYLSHEQLDPILRQSVCLVFTSILEGFGNPPIEAMARSCPTIACNVTAMPEVIGDAGLMVEPHRHDQFGEAILRLYHDRDLRRVLVERGLERIRRFTWTDSAASMFKLLEATASGKAVRAESVLPPSRNAVQSEPRP
jgi:glycosyltransferase involved in cell wall biosynthesis